MEEIKEYTPIQLLAFSNPVMDQEALKNAWSKPFRIPIDKKRTMLINFMIGPSSNPINKQIPWEWSCSIRIHKLGTTAAKATTTWMPFERVIVNKTLLEFMEDLGNISTEELFETKAAMTMNRQLTEIEMKQFRKSNPDMYENKIVPKLN